MQDLENAGPIILPLVEYALINSATRSASHFLCHCNYFAMIRIAIWGKPSLHPDDIDYATVRDIVRFIRKSQRFQ